MKKLSVFGFCVVLVLASSAFAADTKALVKANNQFGITLFNSVAMQEKGNVFLSPLSASMALAVLDNGARGNTKTEIEKTLELNGMNLQSLNASNATFLSQIQKTGPKFTLNLANSVWIRQDYSILSDFVTRAEQSYKAQVEKLDFDSPEASKTINDWVSSKTNNKITEVVPQVLPQDLKIVLINATYFDAQWTHPFKPFFTRPAAFNLRDASTEPVDMMSESASLKYMANNDLEAIELPYGDNDASMIVILPAENKFDAVEKNMTAENLGALEQSLESQTPQLGAISLPKFKFSYQKDLSSILSAMGMADAFSIKADLSGLSSQPLDVSDIVQKTYVAVDEKGTEAAAVTAVLAGMSAMPQYAFNMVVNRPFLVVIKDTQTGTILFIGQIVDPKTN